MSAYGTTLGLNDKMSPVLKTVLRSLGTTLHHLEQIEKETNKTGRSKSFEAMKRSIDDANMAMLKFEKEAEQASQAVERTSGRASAGMSTLTSRILSTVGAYITLRSVASLAKKEIELSDSYTQTQARLQNMTGSLQSAKEMQEQLFDAANRSRGAYQDMSATVAKLGTVAPQYFKDGQELIKFTELMSKSFVVGGASSQEQSAATYQLNQAMASGRLQGDEFRTVREAAPMLQNYIARAMNVSVGDLKELAAEGEITSEVIKNAMFLAADEIEEKFNKMPKTFGQVATLAGNQIIERIQPSLDKLNKLANSQEFEEMMQSGVGVAKTVLNGIAIVTDGVVRHNNLIKASVVGVAGAYSAWMAADYISKIRRLTAEHGKLSTALSKNHANIAKLLSTMKANPIILIISATAAATAAFLAYASSVDTLTNRVGKLHSETQKLVKETNAATANQNSYKESAMGEAIAAQNLADKLYELEKQTGNTEKRKQEMNSIVQQLNSIYPDFSLQIDQQTLAVNKEEVAVNNLIKSFESLAIAQGAALEAVNVGQRIARQQIQLEKLEAEKETAEIAKQNIAEQRTGKGRLGTSANIRFVNTVQTTNDIDEQIKKLTKANESDEATLKKLTDMAASAKTAESSSFGGNFESGGSTVDRVKQVDKVKDDIKISAEDIKLLKDVAGKEFSLKYSQITPQMTVTFGDVRETADVNNILTKLEDMVEQAMYGRLMGGN